MHKFPYEKYVIVGGLIMLGIVLLATVLCSCSFLVKELPLEERIAEEVIETVVEEVEDGGSSK